MLTELSRGIQKKQQLQLFVGMVKGIFLEHLHLCERREYQSGHKSVEVF